MAESAHRGTVALLPQVRVLVLLALAACVLLCLPGVVSGSGPSALRAASLAALGMLLAWWVLWWRRDRLPNAGLPLEVAATTLAVIVIPDPMVALVIVVLTVKFRSLYVGWLRSAVFTAAVLTSLVVTTLAVAGAGEVLNVAPLLLAAPTVMVVTQVVATAIGQRDTAIDRERHLATTAAAIAGAVDRREIADIATSAAIGLMPADAGASAQLTPAGYGCPTPEDGWAFTVPGHASQAAFLVVRVSGAMPSGARHALTTLAETVGRGLSQADSFDGIRARGECDPLTGLPNRPAFTSRLQLAVENACAIEQSTSRRVGLWIVMIDINGFRKVNSRLGHDCGDEVLVVIAGRISACVRPNDLVARLGGDEFGVLVDSEGDCSHSGEQVADRIFGVLRHPIRVAAGDVRTTASLGLGRWEPGVSSDDLLLSAGEAMYRAKADDLRFVRQAAPSRA